MKIKDKEIGYSIRESLWLLRTDISPYEDTALYIDDQSGGADIARVAL